MWGETGDLDIFNFFGDTAGEDSDDGPSTVRTSASTPYGPVQDERAASNFVGLLNQYAKLSATLIFIRGATCYLNSLIQALYMTPEFRQGIYQLIPDEVEQDATEVPTAPVVDQTLKVEPEKNRRN